MCLRLSDFAASPVGLGFLEQWTPPSPAGGGHRRFLSEAAYRNGLTVRLGSPLAGHPAATAVGGVGLAPRPAHTHRIPRPVLTPRQGSGLAPSCVGRPCLGAAAGRWGWGSSPSPRWLPSLPLPAASSSPRLSAVLPSRPAMPSCWSTCRWPMPSPQPPPGACSRWRSGRI